MRNPVSASAARAIQRMKALSIAVVFIAAYTYLRWLPQPHSF
jgi:hypothetical protein